MRHSFLTVWSIYTLPPLVGTERIEPSEEKQEILIRCVCNVCMVILSMLCSAPLPRWYPLCLESGTTSLGWGFDVDIMFYREKGGTSRRSVGERGGCMIWIPLGEDGLIKKKSGQLFFVVEAAKYSDGMRVATLISVVTGWQKSKRKIWYLIFSIMFWCLPGRCWTFSGSCLSVTRKKSAFWWDKRSKKSHHENHTWGGNKCVYMQGCSQGTFSWTRLDIFLEGRQH